MNVLEIKETPKIDLEKPIAEALQIIDRNIYKFEGSSIMGGGINGKYMPMNPKQGWEASFWPGMLWLAYEISGKKKYLDCAENYVERFRERLEENSDLDNHDIGFLYTLSCVSAYKVTGNEQAKSTAVSAADILLKRFNPKGRFIQAWGEFSAEDNNRFIIDSLLNIPLLYWASQVTGDDKYKNIADMHFDTAVKYGVREDFSTYHTYFFDKKDGTPLFGKTAQGAADNSVWARGQAWAIYGAALNYKYTLNRKCVPLFFNLLNCYMDNLPEDLIPCWDMIYSEKDNEPRDSSSTAIVVCGLLQMADLLIDADLKEQLKITAEKMLNSLIKNYAAKESDGGDGLLYHATYSKPNNVGIDDCNIWGDYFYLEALLRLCKNDWNVYW